VGNSSRFPAVTDSASSNKRFRSYRILKIDFAAEFCFWIEQRLNGTELLGLRFTKTPEVPNTVTVGNSLIFLMVHNMAYSDVRFDSYEILKPGQGAENLPDKLDIQINDQVLQAQYA
jgi:hypothetical protein